MTKYLQDRQYPIYRIGPSFVFIRFKPASEQQNWCMLYRLLIGND